MVFWPFKYNSIKIGDYKFYQPSKSYFTEQIGAFQISLEIIIKSSNFYMETSIG